MTFERCHCENLSFSGECEIENCDRVVVSKETLDFCLRNSEPIMIQGPIDPVRKWQEIRKELREALE